MSGNPRFLRCRLGWRRCGDPGASNLRPFWAIAPVKWRRRTFPARCRWRMRSGSRSTAAACSDRTAGQGAMLAVGISREEAARLVERHPGAISIAAVNGPSSITLSGDAAVLAEIDKALNEAGHVQPRLAGGGAFPQPEDGAASKRADGMLARHPAAAGIDAILLHRDRQCCWLGLKWMRGIGIATSGSRCSSMTPWRGSSRQGTRVPRNRRASHPATRHRPVLEREDRARNNAVLRCGEAIASERRCWDRSADCICLGAEIDWQKLFPARRDGDQAAILSVPARRTIGGNPIGPVSCAWACRFIHCLGNRRRSTAADPGKCELDTADLGYLADHRIGDCDRLSGRRICRDGARGGAGDFRAGPLRRWKTSNSRSFSSLTRMRHARRRWCSIPTPSGFDIYASRPMLPTMPGNLHARGYIRRASRPAPGSVDLASIRGRCPDPIDREEYYRLLAEPATTTARPSAASRSCGEAIGRHLPKFTSPAA